MKYYYPFICALVFVCSFVNITEARSLQSCAEKDQINITALLKVGISANQLIELGVENIADIEPIFNQQFKDPIAAKQFRLDSFVRLSFCERESADQILRRLKAHTEIFEKVFRPQVVYIEEPEKVVAIENPLTDETFKQKRAGTYPNDPLLPLQWSHYNFGQEIWFSGRGTEGTDIDFPGAMDLMEESDSLILAIIDSGVNSHEDFGDRVMNGWNVAQSSAEVRDACNHGTHVAGIAAASRDNDLGIAGVSNKARILPVKVIDDDCWGLTEHVAMGIVFAAEQGAHVANMSLQFWMPDPLVEAATNYADSLGMLMVAAAGNWGIDQVAYPSAYPKVMSIAALRNTNTKAGFSNYGVGLDMIAPGVDVLSTLNDTVSYFYKSGTSMASPLVAGSAILLREMRPELNPEEIRQILLESARPRREGEEWDYEFGHGSLDLFRALWMAKPCRVDLDFDEDLNLFDFLQLQTLFHSRSRRVDFNLDRNLDLFDFLEFQTGFDSGCL